MTTITIKRSVPVSPQYEDSTLTLHNPINVSTAIVESLSGLIDDHKWDYDSTTSTVLITAKQSYQDRFKGQKNELAELRDELTKLRNVMSKYERADLYATSVVKRSQFYTRMSRAIHNVWFHKLPQQVKADLSSARIFNLPRLFTIWWLFWSERKPNDFTFPLSAQFPNYSICDEDSDDLTYFLVNNDDSPTELGKVVARAWDFVSVVDRTLMLYCWAARQAEKAIRDGLAHPTISVAEAKGFLLEDMSGLQGLHDRAIAIVEYSKFFVM